MSDQNTALVIDYVRALRDSMYRRELSEELECGVTDMIMFEAADEIERLRAAPKVKPLDDGDFFMIEAEAVGFCRSNEGSSLTYAIMKATERRILGALE